jgi:hypothetical protein
MAPLALLMTLGYSDWISETKDIVMKKITFRELGGACDLEFFENSFDEVADQSKKHGMEMPQAKDRPSHKTSSTLLP